MNVKDEYEKRSYIESTKQFLRLAEKTQVVFPRNGREETVKTRFSHSYEVMTSAFMIARSLSTNLEIDYQKSLGNVCLLHDIGHPAFGHDGAKIINKKMKMLGLSEGFNDNNNNFVVIKKAQIPIEDYDMASLIKYPNKLYKNQEEELTRMLKNSIDEDIMHFEKNFKIYKRPNRTIACEIMDIADSNSYVCSDLSDCYSLGVANEKELLEILENNEFYSFEVKEFLIFAIKAIQEKDKAMIKRAFNILKNKLNENFILGDNLQLKVKNPELQNLKEKLYQIEKNIFIFSKDVIEDRNRLLTYFDFYINYVIDNEYYPSKTYRKRIKNSSGKEKLRNIRDMIGETTDWYVKNFYHKLHKEY